MFITMLKAKLHQARVTGTALDYAGSITIDSELLEQAGMFPYEKVLVADLENGARFETYIIVGQAGSGIIEINGAAARLVSIGDRLIVMAFAYVEQPPPANWQPRILSLDTENRVIHRK